MLVADIGGTNARFALVDASGRLHAERILPCADFAGPSAAIVAYLRQTAAPRPQRAALAVATPISGDRIAFTNNNWSFSTEAVRQELGLERLVIVNDFTALALALPLLAPNERRAIGQGTAMADAPIGLIGQSGSTMALIALGMGLAEYGIRDGLRFSFAVCAIKLVVLPLVVWGLAWLLGLPKMETQVVVLLSSMATGANVYLMSRQFKALEGPTASALVLSTLLASVTTPFILTLMN